LTMPSPRNSSRSLCGVPALRWVSACASSCGSAKRWPMRSPPATGSAFATTTPGDVLGHLELADHVEIADQRPAHLVLHVHVPAGVDALELHVRRLDAL